MFKQNLIILILIFHCRARNNCSLYPFNPILCIQETKINYCKLFYDQGQYNYAENKCIEFNQQDYGCKNNLNKNSCIAQLSDQQKNEVRCLFQNKCIQASNFHLKTLGCNENYSKFSCLNVINEDCIWEEKCLKYQVQDFVKERIDCETYYNRQVSSSMCAKIENYKCLHGGLINDYKCITIQESQLSEISCFEKGLNKRGCLSIITKDQTCIFKNNHCLSVNVSLLDSCNYNINRQACLSSKMNKQLCEWTGLYCRIYLNNNYQCNQIVNVNHYVCQNYDGMCLYNSETQSCEEVSLQQLNNIDCSTLGLSKKACLLIKNNYCTFYRGFCETLTEEDLNVFKCDMLLNEDSCTSIKTQFQYCKWDGIKCDRIFINQDQNCQENNQFKYNGLYCQNISKNKVVCKYDSSSRQCVPSSKDDYCNSPYLNFFGCLSITRHKQTCQWTNNGCILLTIFPFKTTCDSLGYANYNSCSQVIENLQSGCYYDEQIQKCKNVDLSINSKQFLVSIDCEKKSLGLNRILCASIIKPQTACRWHQNECVKINNSKEISDVSCQEMLFSNSQTCAMIQFNQEPCRFEESAKGCINSVKSKFSCDSPGLNSFACSQLEDQCYFSTDTFQCRLFTKQDSQQNENQDGSDNSLQLINSFNSLECVLSSPTKKICLQIVKKGQLCQWKDKLDQCGDIIVSMNQKCTDFVNVNSNVCASVVMDNPDHIPYNLKEKVGYCKYSSLTGSCQVLDGKELCETQCCTETRWRGINQHSCSRLTNKTSAYCYFENYQCKELTSDLVDITNEQAVKQYFNANQFMCSQMGKNSCHMIEWSTQQLCYYNGVSCINVNYENYKNFKVFTMEPAILNSYACLAIEASLTFMNIEKFFEYDYINHRCKSVQQLTTFQYQSCEQVIGNSNMCLRFTENLYCQWDKKLLKCITIPLEDLAEMASCDLNQNIKACKENIHSPCFFSFDLDKCIRAVTYVNCNYFDSKGPVSQKVCQLIDFPQQQCEWSNYTCITTDKTSELCDVIGANQFTCYKNTKGKCRWSKEASICYEIPKQQNISELGCEDNLNQSLCKLITREACIWDDTKFDCSLFQSISYSDFQKLNRNNLYTERACRKISGAGIKYDDKNNKCTYVQDTNKNNPCETMTNDYACLYLTRGSQCVYDITKTPPCQQFTDEQTQCTTSKNINIEICMKIPKQCYFSKLKLQCLIAEIPSSQTCSSLNSQLNFGNHYNKLSCSSISQLRTEPYSKNQCYQEQDEIQQCNQERFCEWDNQLYGCKVKELNILFFDRENTVKGYIYEYKFSNDDCQEDYDCNQTVKIPEEYFLNIWKEGTPSSLQCGVKKRCQYQNKACKTKSDCLKIYSISKSINEEGIQIDGVKLDQDCNFKCQKQDQIICNQNDTQQLQEIIKASQVQSQKCVGICESQSKDNKPCIQDKECGSIQVFNETTRKCRWSKEASICYEIPKQQNISELGCEDNLNQSLCKLITREACIWDDTKFDCSLFQSISYSDFQKLNRNNLYTERACRKISGAGIKYDDKNNKCTYVQDTNKNNPCETMTNDYACLYLTRGSQCVYDITKTPPCQQFTDEQTQCTTSKNINIEICMKIPKQCYFSKLKLQCLIAEIPSSQTCSSLNSQLNFGNHYNKLSCSSISQLRTEPYSKNQCYQEQDEIQQCNQERFCEWDNQLYGCKVKELNILFFDRENTVKGYIYEYKFSNDDCQEDYDCNQTVKIPEEYFLNIWKEGTPSSLQCGVKKRCQYQNKACKTKSDCLKIYSISKSINEEGIQIDGVKLDQDCNFKCQKQDQIICNQNDTQQLQEIIKASQVQSQKCVGICESQSKDNKPCIQDKECGSIQVFNETTSIYQTKQSLCQNKKCAQGKNSCSGQSDCPDYVEPRWETKVVECAQKDIFTIKPLCKGFGFIALKCNNTYSKALCLYGVLEECIFDLNQGGCIQLKGNENKIPDCSAISSRCKPKQEALDCDSTKPICKNSTLCESTNLNSCLNSLNKKVICQAGQMEIIPNQKSCYSLQRQIQICEPLKLPEGLLCESFTDNVSPALCASAINNCRFHSFACVSTIPKNENNKCICDSSFSKSLCEECNCFFDFVGYCQQQQEVPQLKQDQSNKYFLCYEVNLLNIADKSRICALVEQACKFYEICEDATNYTCEQLNGYITSIKACTKCEGYSTQYSLDDHICRFAILSQKKCDLLNRQGCLQKTKGIMCKWEDYKCKEITQITGSDIRDCSIYNREACIEFQHDCWFDLDIGYCTQFDPNKGSCNLLLNEDLCMFSLKESCLWDSNIKICVQNEKSVSDCKELNKYGCLNQQILLCVWSDLYKCLEADFDENADSCDSPIKEFKESFQRSYVTHYSKKICSSIKINLNCFQDNYYQCRETIVTDIIKCDSNGLNRFGCLNRSSGKCQYVDQEQLCKYNLNDQIGCLDSLNEEACNSQKLTCKFEKNTCSPLSLKNLSEILDTNQTYQYSKSVCSSLDNDHLESLIFSEVQKRCLLISHKQPFIDYCTKFVGNKYACLQKTTSPCEYNNLDKTCFATSQVILKTPLNCFTEKDINWVTCISLFSKCKFINNKCQAINSNDSCESLQNQNAIVNASICATRTDKKCKLNVNSNTCEVIQDNFQQLNIQSYLQCSTPGLNKIGCIFITKGYQCRFSNNQCIFDFGQALCNDFINEDKCYQIKTKGQYCKFDDKGCQQITNRQELNKCNHEFKTNPVTCSASQDIACHYNIIEQQCQEFKNPSSPLKSNLGQNFFISNLLSFNSQACQINNILRLSEKNINSSLDQEQSLIFLKTKWTNQCVEIVSTDINTLKCNDQVNEKTCLEIRTPFQYCQFINQKCQFQDLNKFKQTQCNLIQKINSGIFCQINEVYLCEFKESTQSCQDVDPNINPENIKCVDENPSTVGYSKKACKLNIQNCNFIDGCYQIAATNNIKFCNQFQEDNCNQAKREGCKIDQKQCLAITSDEYSTLQCSQAANKIGCLNITSKKQFCKYEGEICKFIKIEGPYGYCLNLQQINSYVFCENTFDIPCQFNAYEYKCEQTNSDSYLPCIRGLNQIACLTSTKQTLQCQFYHYCYGPNYDILNCKSTHINDCCLLANTIESCLFQDQFSCQWQNEQCSEFSEQYGNQTCEILTNVSRKVCYEKENSNCIFDIDQLKCIEINPETCDQVQTKEQCNKLQDLPCYWDIVKLQCLFKDKNSNDGCQDIQDQWGSQRACLDVERQGQMCIFDQICITYVQTQDIGCSKQLNRQSCLKQVFHQCFWNVYQVEVKKYSQSKSKDTIEFGICLEYNQESNSKCNSNLSYLACLNINTPNIFCKWEDYECKDVKNNSIFTLRSFSQVNCNTCGIINDGSHAMCDIKNFKCQNIQQQKINLCDLPGMNREACFHVKGQPCKWNDITKRCLKQNESVDSKKLNSQDSCKLTDVNIEVCSKLYIPLPCGFFGSYCDQIDLNQISCDYPGLNQYACLNIKNYPCGWIYDDILQNYECKFIQDFDTCLGYQYFVNPFVCTQIIDGPCFYNQNLNNCVLLQQTQTQCNLIGINNIGCSFIENCVFFNGNCVKYDKTMNLSCEDALFSNYQVCSQIEKNRCKYNILGYGCISSEMQDLCSTKGINQIGCNDLIECQWNISKCQCKSMITKYPECDLIKDSKKCQSLNYCYIYASNSQYAIDITQQIINQNLAKCLRKTCAYYLIDECDSQQIDTDICYINSKNECKQASRCEEIISPMNDCQKYIIKNKQCLIGYNTNNCIASPECEILDKDTCLQFTDDCFYESACKTLDCRYFTTEKKCIKKNCEWQKQNKVCINSKLCASLDKEFCMNSKQNGKQCVLIGEEGENQFCTDIGCRYLQIKYSLCNGAQIGEEACVTLSDSSCVSCEEIIDPCICLLYQDSCEYDRFYNMCKSITCESFNEETCPSTRCQFDLNNQVCIPFCQNNYNPKQCNIYEFSCYWNYDQQLCIQIKASKIQKQPENNIQIFNVHQLVLRLTILFLILEF
ncbi:unnamed protein product [Paramecium sonneborni]|uniref:Transmembrane protein n=1 Tax=Paramecium sonneborni TaxID=65129 RepID=A0A8S1L5R3_9CILI|nr:unnamed protein product [Paramecium sonneborni]